MKRLGIIILTLALVATSGAFAWAELTQDQDNEIFYRNFENVFDENGNYVEAGSRELQAGDHLMGIINVQHINVGGETTWFQSTTDQITGIFAQRVEAVVDPDTYDTTGNQTLPHIVLGPPTITQFCKDGDCVDTSGLLAPGEMFALYRQTGAGTTPFEYDGTMADDVAKATDGDLWLTLTYSAEGDGFFGTSDDNGYFYSHTAFGVPLVNFTGEAWGGLNAVVNNTGYALAGVNDPNELEMDTLICGFNGCLANNIHLSSELEGNPGSPLIPGGGDFSPWDIRSNDPAHVFPTVTFPGACRMTGGNVTVNAEYVPGTFIVTLDYVEGTYAEVSSHGNNGNGNGNKKWYTVGGQVGAPKANDPSYGEWTHVQHAGFNGSFTFHAGTHSAPPETEITSIECDDPGWCVQARCAPFKQIFWNGIGQFKNEKGYSAAFPGCNVVPGETLHYFEAHVLDAGEPGNNGKQKNENKCEWQSGGLDIGDVVFIDTWPADEPFASKGGAVCDECPDYYEIEIHCTTDPSSAVIYSVADFIDGGNFQIHPEVGQSCQ
jgi:hypothetical protein